MTANAPTTYAAEVAARVRAEMARRKKSSAELGDVLEIARQTAEVRLRGEKPFDLLELARIAIWLGVPISDFTTTDGGDAA